MRKLILPLALIVACGPAMADEPTNSEWQAIVKTQVAVATSAADRVLYATDSPDKLKAGADSLEDALRAHLQPIVGARYPCVYERSAPAPLGVSTTPILMQGSCNVAIGLDGLQNATTMNATMAIGNCSGVHLENESRDLLIGHHTAAPRGRDGFVNIANKLCFWRDTGERVACPAPEPECEGK